MEVTTQAGSIMRAGLGIIMFRALFCHAEYDFSIILRFVVDGRISLRGDYQMVSSDKSRGNI